MQVQEPMGKCNEKLCRRPMGDMYMLKVIGTFNTEKDLAQYAKTGLRILEI